MQFEWRISDPVCRPAEIIIVSGNEELKSCKIFRLDRDAADAESQHLRSLRFRRRIFLMHKARAHFSALRFLLSTHRRPQSKQCEV